MICAVYIHRRTVCASLVELNEGMIMSELLDKQNENLKIKIPGFTQAPIKGVMKTKVEELEKESLLCY